MTSSSPTTPTPTPLQSRGRQPGFFRQWLGDWFTLRKRGPLWESLLLGVLCLAACFAAWWLLTLGSGEERIIGPLTLPSPAETFARAPDLFREPIYIVSNT